MTNRFEYTDASGDKLTVLPAKGGILIEAENAPHVTQDHIEEVVSGIRDMARQAGRQPARDCPSCQAGIEHTAHCPTPETHNYGCGCATDEQPRPVVYITAAPRTEETVRYVPVRGPERA